ncbi:putative TIM-barrel fold metal-dependent hydrolase [Parabacteroides sp. PFB2-10]|uniref:amidohydrolase family protein n=1 Tax=Parabacteroides sp. PFB2-10 TaxID=1742405 RepID=UPI00247688B4|nr:amidohydrolase family protein [Parabacteroides sp. PFB2-10]MDH6313609.1 putative TIM-barrel fold metal-dependent hydrolase [Parabacteroides sp. PFB2-10]MDL2244479.1 amidohydrolase [Parabacteroides sp. OttesenSCG-928-J18]
MYPIIDAHAHLWLHQEAIVEGKKIRTLENGRSEFMGEIRQMIPPFLVDGRNTAEAFLANMDYAQVSAAVITQEYIDGMQNEYLLKVEQQYPNRFFCCGMVDARKPGYYAHAEALIAQGFRAIKIPAQRLVTAAGRVWLTEKEMMDMFRLMEKNNIILSIDLADGAEQVAEMKEIIAECPSLKIAIGHFGMVTREGWQEQIKLARNEYVRIESGGITWLFNDEFYPFTGAVRAIQEAAGLVGMEKLMWGSDYPRTIVAITYRMSYDFVIKSNLLSEEEKSLFLGKNAEAFYGLKNLPQLPYIKNMSE